MKKALLVCFALLMLVAPLFAQGGNEAKAPAAKTEATKKVFPAGTILIWSTGQPQFRKMYYQDWLDKHRDIAPNVNVEVETIKTMADGQQKLSMKAATGRKGFNVLHMCKDYLALDRYKAYPADVVNWSTFEHNISLEEGRKLFEGKAVLGGFDDRSGLLVDGTEDEIADFARSLVKRMGKTKYILGADCTLPTEIARERIRVAVEAARTC